MKNYLSTSLSDFYKVIKPTSNIYFNDIVEEHDDYVVAEFYGGLNGHGDWVKYTRDIAALFYTIQSDYKCWLVSLENDCLDDVFYLKIGIKKK